VALPPNQSRPQYSYQGHLSVNRNPSVRLVDYDAIVAALSHNPCLVRYGDTLRGMKRHTPAVANLCRFFEPSSTPVQHVMLLVKHKHRRTAPHIEYTSIFDLPPHPVDSQTKFVAALADVPLLIGLDIISRHGLNVLIATDEITSATVGWSLPVHRQHGHLALRWKLPSRSWYTRS
jgi:hypothetical protein